MTKPSKCYRELKSSAFTRKEYIKRGYPDVPEGLSKMTYGNSKQQDWKAKVSLIALKDGQVSSKSLESIRVTVNKELKVLGEEKYCLRMKSYPFHVNREHGLIGIAKAERFCKGMRLGFGKSNFRSSRLKKGTELFVIFIDDNAVSFHLAKRACKMAIKKLPLKWKIYSEGISSKNILANPILPKRAKESKGGLASIQREISKPKVGN